MSDQTSNENSWWNLSGWLTPQYCGMLGGAAAAVAVGGGVWYYRKKQRMQRAIAERSQREMEIFLREHKEYENDPVVKEAVDAALAEFRTRASSYGTVRGEVFLSLALKHSRIIELLCEQIVSSLHHLIGLPGGIESLSHWVNRVREQLAARLPRISAVFLKFFDRDGDNEVSEAEFLAGILLLQGYSSKDFLLQLFRLQDTDQSGDLSLNEVGAVVDFLLSFVRGTVYVVCEILDEEIVDQLAEQSFAHMDRDGSGSIDMVEWLMTRRQDDSHGIERLLMTEFVSQEDVPKLLARFKELADEEGYVSRLQFVDHMIGDAMMSGLRKRFAAVANQDTLTKVLHSPSVLGLMQNFFHFLDKDGDGRLSFGEFEQGLTLLAQPPQDSNRFQFSGIASGVGLRESTIALDMVASESTPIVASTSSSSSATAAFGTDAKWKAVFELYDVDHDGTVSIVEVRSLYRGLMSLVTGLLRSLVDSFHTQRDSIWEVVEDMFALCDEDGDGSLTAEEFTTFFDEHVIKTVEIILAKHDRTLCTDMIVDFLGMITSMANTKKVVPSETTATPSLSVSQTLPQFQRQLEEQSGKLERRGLLTSSLIGLPSAPIGLSRLRASATAILDGTIDDNEKEEEEEKE